ncbi:MAG: hypothetical protein ACLVL7_11555 [Anaerotruncus massiliensis (ex Togo et al. 2019)]
MGECREREPRDLRPRRLPRQCASATRKASRARGGPDGNRSRRSAPISRALAGADTDAEIAFFGGSFTAIGRDYMLELLEAAAPLWAARSGIRISTRPDAVDEERSACCGGADDRGRARRAEHGRRVLDQNLRGHTAADVERAAGSCGMRASSWGSR